MSAGPFWDGQPRNDYSASAPLVSPYDRPPVPQVLAASRIPADSPDLRERVNFAPWCGWVYVTDDGGGTLIIYPSLGGGIPQPARTGDVVWIGNGSCEIAYVTAPTLPVMLMGCTSVDAMLFASQGRGAGAGGSASGARSSELITGDTKGVVLPVVNTYAPLTGSVSVSVTKSPLRSDSVTASTETIRVGKGVGSIAAGNFATLQPGDVATFPGSNLLEVCSVVGYVAGEVFTLLYGVS